MHRVILYFFNSDYFLANMHSTCINMRVDYKMKLIYENSQRYQYRLLRLHNRADVSMSHIGLDEPAL